MEPALAGSEIKSLALYAILVLISLLLSAVFFFVKKLITKVDTMWDKLIVIDSHMARFSDDVAYIKGVKSEIRDRFDDLTILKRDQSSIWKSIDELRKEIRAEH